ncbi:MAG TPA: patatin-like phospholipase family protein [Cyclobacteriaceae bacterium]|nr:patatin-like phospholipase family protein [Cyclobacteriaceae bacterium]
MIHNLYRFFSTDQRLLLIASILLAVSFFAWVESSNSKLETPEAPLKIVSLQKTSNAGKAATIVNSWRERDLIPTAELSIQQDYYMIFSYVMCLVFLVMAVDSKPVSRATVIFCWLAVFAGLCDVVENIFVTMFLRGQIQSALPFFLPAMAKFALGAAVVVYLLVQFVRLKLYRNIGWNSFVGIGHSLKSVRIYLPGFITVLVSYFVFSKLPQGQDVIIQITEFFGPFLWAICCVPVWAVFCWYSSRLVGYEKSLQPGSDVPEEYHTHVPRLIAYNCLVSIQAAILALPTIGNLSQGAIWAFVLVQNLLYFFRHKVLTINPAPIGYRAISWSIIIVYGIVIAYLTFVGKHLHARLLPGAAYGLFLFQLFLMYAFIRRRRTIAKATTTYESVGYLRLFNRNVIHVPQSVVQSEQYVFKSVAVVFAIGLAIYITAIFFPYLADHMGPLTIAVLSFGVLVAISNVITIISIQKGINLFAVLFVWAIVLGNIFNPYSVRTVTMNKEPVVKRPGMKGYVERWLQKRERMIDHSTTFPVYLVIADGGASRSGYWVASVLSAIQDKTNANDPGNAFAEHVLVLAGASGGSVGNATFYALLKNNLQDTVYSYRTSSQNFLSEDFLSPVLIRWLGSDFFKHIVPLPVDDRAIALEKGMEYFSNEHLRNAFAKPFTHAIDTSGCLPILFINTTNVQQGVPAVVSSIRIDSISQRVDVLTQLAQTYPNDTLDINYSTGVVMGARFPYVSPAGNIGNKSFVDGGYFDNTGAGILHEMMQVLVKDIRNNMIKISSDTIKNRQLLSKLKFQLLYLRNSSLDTTTSKVMHPLVNDAAAPIITVLGTYGSQTDINNSRLKRFMESLDSKGPSVDMNLYRKTDEEEFPMNWVISTYNLGRMDANLNDVMSKEYDSLLVIPTVPDSLKCKCRKL